MVVKTQAVVYARVTGGISIYAWRIIVGKDIFELVCLVRCQAKKLNPCNQFQMETALIFKY